MNLISGSLWHEFYEHFYVRSQGIRAGVNSVVKKRILMSAGIIPNEIN